MGVDGPVSGRVARARRQLAGVIRPSLLRLLPRSPPLAAIASLHLTRLPAVAAGASDSSPNSARDYVMYEKGIECEEVRLRKEGSCSCKGRAEDRARLSTGASRRRARGRSSLF